MQFLPCLCLLLGVAFAAPTPTCVQNVNITTTQWLMPSTKATPGASCSYVFSFPSNSYANIAITATGMASELNSYEVIRVINEFNNHFQMEQSYTTPQPTLTSSSNWPGTFTVTVQAETYTNMRVQMTVSIRRMNMPVPSRYITTATNGPSSLIYLNEFKKGTAVSITANSTRAFVTPVVTYQGDNFSYDGKQAGLSNIFVYENGKSVGNLLGKDSNPLFSRSKTLTLYAAEDTTPRMTGAVFVSDDTNVIISTSCQYLNYEPVYQSQRKNIKSFWGCSGDFNVPPQSNTFVADNGRNTTMTVTKIDNIGAGGVFSYQIGGPTESFKKTALNITNADLPITISGQMVTFYISQHWGSIIFDLN